MPGHSVSGGAGIAHIRPIPAKPDTPDRSRSDPLKRYVLPESVEQVSINPDAAVAGPDSTGTADARAGLVQTSERVATGHSKFRCDKSVPQMADEKPNPSSTT